MPQHVQIFPSHKIDLIKWDQCIAQNTNGLIYAQSVYLHAMTQQWHGLIIEDYKAILPLPWKKKYGIRYLYTPGFTQQLGLIGVIEIDPHLILEAITSFATYSDYFFNHQNHFVDNKINTQIRNNYLLDLSAGYDFIQSNYKNNLLRNLKKIDPTQLMYCIENDPTETINLHKQLHSEQLVHVSNEDYNRFTKLTSTLLESNQCIIRQVKNNNGEILSAALLLKDDRRLYNIINATTNKGKDLLANHFLMDQIIREFAGLSLLLDFEGSNIPGVQHFYEMFGSFNQPYFHWHHNNLPWPLQLFKR
jgi:hypothetical protein